MSSANQKETVTLWAVSQSHSGKVSLESHEALERPNSFVLDGRQTAFGCRKQIPSAEADLTPEAAVARYVAAQQRKQADAAAAVTRCLANIEAAKSLELPQ